MRLSFIVPIILLIGMGLPMLVGCAKDNPVAFNDRTSDEGGPGGDCTPSPGRIVVEFDRESTKDFASEFIGAYGFESYSLFPGWPSHLFMWARVTDGSIHEILSILAADDRVKSVDVASYPYEDGEPGEYIHLEFIEDISIESATKLVESTEGLELYRVKEFVFHFLTVLVPEGEEETWMELFQEYDFIPSTGRSYVCPIN